MSLKTDVHIFRIQEEVTSILLKWMRIYLLWSLTLNYAVIILTESGKIQKPQHFPCLNFTGSNILYDILYGMLYLFVLHCTCIFQKYPWILWNSVTKTTLYLSAYKSPKIRKSKSFIRINFLLPNPIPIWQNSFTFTLHVLHPFCHKMILHWVGAFHQKLTLFVSCFRQISELSKFKNTAGRYLPWHNLKSRECEKDIDVKVHQPPHCEQQGWNNLTAAAAAFDCVSYCLTVKQE